MIKLTNAAVGMENKPLLINFAHVKSVFPFLRQDKQEVTVVYSGEKEVWEVKETVAAIYKLVGA
jgi:hypothetical protein